MLLKRFHPLNWFVLVLMIMPGIVWADWQLDMTPGVTDIGQQVYGLHRLMFKWCVVIACLVFGVMLYALIKHRKAAGHQAVQFHESTLIEIVWTVIPFIILVIMAVPATRVLVAMDDSSESILTVKVTALQWKWHYDYLEYEGKFPIDVAFYSNLGTPREQFETPLLAAGLFPLGVAARSPDKKAETTEKNPNYLLEVDNPLVIPTGKKVRLLLTSADVVHAWWVPDFGVKKDAIPGFINEIWVKVPEGKEGIYRGQCAELCGKDHGFMPIVVEAKNEAGFAQWLADTAEAQKQAQALQAASLSAEFTKEELMQEGATVYQAKCAACHQPNGVGMPPMFPSLIKTAIVTGPVAEHIRIVRFGKGAMPAFEQQLSPKEMAAVITYERNAWGNDTGDVVQPREVMATSAE